MILIILMIAVLCYIIVVYVIWYVTIVQYSGACGQVSDTRTNAQWGKYMQPAKLRKEANFLLRTSKGVLIFTNMPLLTHMGKQMLQIFDNITAAQALCDTHSHLRYTCRCIRVRVDVYVCSCTLCFYTLCFYVAVRCVAVRVDVYVCSCIRA